MPAVWGDLTDQQRIQFSASFMRQAAYNSVLCNPKHGLVGDRNSRKPIILHSECGPDGRPGNQIRIWFRPSLGGVGIGSNANLSANAKDLPKIYKQDITLDLTRNAVKEQQSSQGKQKSYFEWRTDAHEQLEEWAGRMWDIALAAHACGYYPSNATKTTASYNDGCGNLIDVTDPQWTGNVQPVDFPAAYKIFPTTSITDEDSIGNTNLFTTDMIERAVRTARDQSYGIQPLDDGRYLLLIDPYHLAQLRQDTNYKNIVTQDVTFRGADKNTMVTGRIQQWADVNILECPYLTPGIANAGTVVSDVRRSVLLGRNALAVAQGLFGGMPGQKYGSLLEFTYESNDHGEQNQVGVKWFWGVQSVRFDLTGHFTVNPIRRWGLCLPAYTSQT